MSNPIKAWHFVRKNRRLGYGDDRIVAPGYTYYEDPDATPVLCRIGLHGSIKPLDALKYAPGPICCRVEISGTVVKGDDKLVGTERTVLAMCDATEILRKFARLCALDVIHLWDAPDVVVRYLKTGDEKLRAAAEAAAEAAAWGEAWGAARAAARAAAWAAARTAAEAAAEAAARAAARTATWDAAWGEARAAAWGEARDKRNRKLTRMLNAEMRGAQR